MSEVQINIIVPLFNEEDVFSSLINRLDKLMQFTELTIEVILVDDGSTDNTSKMMNELSQKNENYQSIFLSRNFGHQIAITAGLQHANAREAVMIIDADLQDPPEMLQEFYKLFKQGYDIVYAVRKDRKELWYKRVSYKLFYSLMKRISNIQIPINSGDFSLISVRAVNYLNQMPEESRYLRGMRSWIGFRQKGIIVERDERQAGNAKYSIAKLIKLALNGVFNFSEYPIRFIFVLGLLVIVISSIYLGYAVVQKLIYNASPDGFTALLFTIVLFGGIQLISLGLIGGYVIRIFFQVKNRPLFIVRSRISKKQNLSK